MCSSNPGGVVLPFGIKVPNPSPYVQFPGGIPHVALDLHRAQQLCDYSSRLQYGVRGFPTQMGFAPYHPPSTADPYLHHYFYKDPRVRYVHEEPKPNHSYIGLIAMAILSSRDKKLVLSDIYQWILDNYPYFRTRGPGWRNSIRHNLSLNDCFIKSGRSANGKGHYWAIHPANVDDFQKGDFRRRRAQRRVRKHMGLSVPDDDDSPSPSPTSSTRPNWDEDENIEVDDKVDDHIDDEAQSSSHSPSSESGSDGSQHNPTQTVSKKRLFDMESLLAPDDRLAEKRLRDSQAYNEVHVRRLSSADVEDTNKLLRHCPSNEIGSTDTFRCDDKVSTDINVEGHFEKVKSETDPSVLQREEALSVSETASKLWQQGFKQFGMPMMISHPSAFHTARAGYPWNALTSYLGAFPLLSVKSNLPSSLSFGHKSVSLDQTVQNNDTQIKTENDTDSVKVENIQN